MSWNSRTLGLVAASIVATVSAVAPAAAVTLLDAPASTGQVSDSGPRDYSFTGGAGLASLTFNLEGYLSLDGFGNDFTDTFLAKLNGVDFLSGSFNMSGGGTNVLYLQPTGTSFTTVTNPGGIFLGGSTSFSTTLNLVEGLNTLSFSFIGPLQGAGDEGWGINSVLVDGNAVGAIPEPAAWAMLIVGFGIAGATLRYRRRSTKVAFAAA